MPIRFACEECGRLLSTARRKVGTAIDCPKCGHTQTVPDPSVHYDGSSANLSQRASEPTPESIVVHENRPKPADVPRRSTPVDPAETDGPGDLVAPDMVLVSRRAIHAQGALLAVVGVVGLLAGCLIGRGCASVDSIRRQDAAPSDPVLVEGKLLYRPSDMIAGDENAVAIFLPEDAKPPNRIETPGIRPEDSPTPGYSSLREIRALGGAYARADHSGDFSVVLPREGKYFVLLVSANTRRPDDADVEEIDLEDLDPYFRRPEYLIGRQKYRWTLDTLSGYARIEYDFGRNRKGGKRG